MAGDLLRAFYKAKADEYGRVIKGFFDTKGFERLREVSERSQKVVELAGQVAAGFKNGNPGLLLRK